MQLYELWQRIVAQYPFMETLWDALRVIVPFSLMLAFAGIIFISATAKILFISRKRSAFDKCSRQLATLGLILGWTLLICSRVWLYYTRDIHAPGTLESFLLEMSWLLLSLGVLLTSVYFTLWRILRNMPVVHVTIGMISAVQNCISLVVILFTFRISAASQMPKGMDNALAEIFPSTWNDPVWTAACCTPPLIFGLAAALGACWLALRRKHDDFGRDYYNAMLPWCAGWAKNSWGLLWLLLAVALGLQFWGAYQANSLNIEKAFFDGAPLLLWLIPWLLWIYVHKSKMALRVRWALFVALLIACCFTLPYYLEITFI